MYFIGSLSPIPNQEESLLHWTAHIETDSGFLGGPSEIPRRVKAGSISEVFEVSIVEGLHDPGCTFATVRVGGREYLFRVE